MYHFGGHRALHPRPCPGLVRGPARRDLHLPHAALYVCERVCVYGHKERHRLWQFHCQKGEAAVGALSHHFRHCHHAQASFTRRMERGSSRLFPILCADVLPARGGAFLVVRLGIMVDVCHRSPFQDSPKPSRAIRGHPGVALCAPPVAPSLLFQRMQAHVCILHAGCGRSRGKMASQLGQYV